MSVATLSGHSSPKSMNRYQNNACKLFECLQMAIFARIDEDHNNDKNVAGMPKI